MDSAVKVELPEEMVLEEILPRVEVKSLLRWKCVSRSWRSLIEAKPFINKHLNFQRRRSRVVFNCRCGLSTSPSYLGDEEPSAELSPIDHNNPPTNHPNATGCYVVGHHDGMLCILETRSDGHDIFNLWNPATKVFAQLPYAELIVERFKLGFGWDERSGAYKVFLGVPDHDFYHDDDEEGDHDGRIARIYSSETNSWKTVEHGSDSLRGRFGVFAGGRIYWLTNSGHIEYFDLRNEVFGKTMIDQPCKFNVGDNVRLWLWERRESLCIVCDTYNKDTKRSVWVMNKEKENWVEDGGLAYELGMYMGVHGVYGVYGAYNYFETLVSPLLFLQNTS